MRAAGRDVCSGFEIGVDEDQKLIGGALSRQRPVAIKMWEVVMGACGARRIADVG
jgi:hypothetical protein